MYSLKVEIVRTDGQVPYPFHNPGDFGLPRINDLYHT